MTSVRDSQHQPEKGHTMLEDTNTRATAHELRQLTERHKWAERALKTARWDTANAFTVYMRVDALAESQAILDYATFSMRADIAAIVGDAREAHERLTENIQVLEQDVNNLLALMESAHLYA
jgi:multidrug resistance efflux pump